MKKYCAKYLSLGLFLLFMNANSFAGIPVNILSAATGQEMPSLAPMLDQVTPAVVNISTRSRVKVQDNPLLNDPFFRRFFNLPQRQRERESQSLGSGVVVDAKKGFIITNNHVIDKADEITVTLRDNRKLKAELIGRDPETDIAVIKVEPDKLSAVELSNSDALRVGDFVIAIGNPFGLGQTVTSGIVSALGRRGLGIEGYEDFIQTDASINPGNSGGALVNLRGELVGINTAILSPGGGGNVGIGFAIPANMVQDVMHQLIKHGEVKRGRLGIYVQDLTEELANAFGLDSLKGAVVSQVMEESPAQKAGLRAGDVIVLLNSRAVDSTGDLRNIIGLLRVGSTVDMEIVRNGKRKNITVVITEQASEKITGEKISKHLKGAELAVIEEDGTNTNRMVGIEVIDIEKDSAAWRTGLRKNDVIMSVNRIRVRNFSELKQAIQSSRRGMLINILRGDGGLFLLVQ